MSLNCKEIDLVLAELELEGSRIQKIYQPSYDTIVLELFARGAKSLLLVSVAAGACRLHGLSALPTKNERALRFMECLKSRLKGGMIDSAVQLSGQRIVRLVVAAPEGADSQDLTDPRPQPRFYNLFFRLWSGAGNMILVDDKGFVVDALLRKPDRGEVSGAASAIDTEFGKTLSPEESAALDATYKIRDLPGDGSFSNKLEAFYTSKGGQWSREKLVERAKERYEKRLAALTVRKAQLKRLIAEYSGSERLRQIGDILMACVWTADATRRGDSHVFVEIDDFFNGKNISVQIDPAKSAVENARLYYEKAKKAASGLISVTTEMEKARTAETELDAWLAATISEQDPFAIAQTLEKAGTVRERPKRLYSCLWIKEKGWTILVGRSAKENDELLRHKVRGSDLWLHARDYAGAYVFVKARKGKTFPLDILLDAGNLAIYYSKARKNSGGDVYYTFAKYLRRVKDGPKGLVIPNLEKNLSVQMDEKRIRELLACSQGAVDEAGQ
ncbi:MAG: NFACT RNA binding domain-containing protein [Spirochaetes bacterium]|nr:NFACT RNA binding domain-containing protein [Spirochaetota bacterium]